MASGQTTNYGLNQWAAEDNVLRQEFNQDNAKIEQAILAAHTGPSCVTGSYVGNDEDITVELGFKPSFLIVIPSNRSGSYSSDIMGIFGFSGIMVEITRYDSIGIFSKCEFTDIGFKVTKSNMTSPQITFLYAAFY